MRTLVIALGLLSATTAWADEPRELAAEAKALERAADWQGARDAYVKLESFDAYRGVALYGEAWVTFQTGDFASARDLAAKAIAAPHGKRDEARELYGDALFKLREYQRARAVYVATEKLVPAPRRAMLRKKIAVCDLELRTTA